jgi:hypothetical protein
MCVTSIYHQAQEAGVAVDESVGEQKAHESLLVYVFTCSRSGMERAGNRENGGTGETHITGRVRELCGVEWDAKSS